MDNNSFQMNKGRRYYNWHYCTPVENKFASYNDVE
jgi:hypothetical protein